MTVAFALVFIQLQFTQVAQQKKKKEKKKSHLSGSHRKQNRGPLSHVVTAPDVRAIQCGLNIFRLEYCD